MAKGKTPKRAPLTEFESGVAKKLKQRWLDIPIAERPTQWEMAAQWGEGGSQSVISQYLNGKIPLNIPAAYRFSRIFRCKPEEILDVPELHGRSAPLPDNVIQLKKSWPLPGVDPDALSELDPGDRREIAGMINEKIRQAQKANPKGKRSRG